MDITCTDPASFRTWPASELDRVIQMLSEAHRRNQHGRLSNAKYVEIQQACGMSYNASGLLASSRLTSHCSLLGVVTLDWVHTLLQDGVFVLEASLVVKACGDRLEAMGQRAARVAQAFGKMLFAIPSETLPTAELSRRTPVRARTVRCHRVAAGRGSKPFWQMTPGNSLRAAG